MSDRDEALLRLASALFQGTFSLLRDSTETAYLLLDQRAEIERLRAEVERLRAVQRDTLERSMTCRAERDALRALLKECKAVMKANSLFRNSITHHDLCKRISAALAAREAI